MLPKTKLFSHSLKNDNSITRPGWYLLGWQSISVNQFVLIERLEPALLFPSPYPVCNLCTNKIHSSCISTCWPSSAPMGQAKYILCVFPSAEQAFHHNEYQQNTFLVYFHLLCKSPMRANIIQSSGISISAVIRRKYFIPSKQALVLHGFYTT